MKYCNFSENAEGYANSVSIEGRKKPSLKDFFVHFGNMLQPNYAREIFQGKIMIPIAN